MSNQTTYSVPFRTFRPEVGIFNALNANPVTAQTNAFGPALDRVTAILPGRLIRVGITVKY